LRKISYLLDYRSIGHCYVSLNTSPQYIQSKIKGGALAPPLIYHNHRSNKPRDFL